MKVGDRVIVFDAWPGVIKKGLDGNMKYQVEFKAQGITYLARVPNDGVKPATPKETK